MWMGLGVGGLGWGLAPGLVMTCCATDYSNTVEAASAYTQARMLQDHVPGVVVALVDSQQVVWATGFGYADLEQHIPAQPGTVYRIGSVSKMFATVALMQLAEQGIISLDSPVADLLPGFAIRNRDFGLASTNPLVARHLVNYHAGLPGDLMNTGFTFSTPYDGFEDWLFHYLPETYPLYPPDLINNYCNAGFTLAERVVRLHNTNGLSYADYCRASIFDLLGMASTSLLKDRAAISNRLARVYEYSQGRYLPFPEQYANMRGAGGAYSTAEDLARFAMMFLNNGTGPSGQVVLNAASVAAMAERQGAACALNVDNRWVPGLGWDAVTNARLSHAHSRVCLKGGSVEYGHCAFIEILLDAQLAAVVLADAEINMLWDVADEILRHALADKFGRPIPGPVTPLPSSLVTNMPLGQLAPWAGVYTKITGFDLVQTRDHSLLWITDAQKPDAAALELWPRENGWFSAADSQQIEVCFTNIEQRQVMLLRYLWPDASFIWQLLYAERHFPSALPAAWSNRFDKLWPVVDAAADDYQYVAVEGLGLPAGLRLSRPHGVLTIKDLSGSVHVLQPLDEDTALICGLTPRCDSALRRLQTNGMDVLQFGGYRYQDPAQVPVLGFGAGVSSQLVAEGLSALFAFAPSSTGLVCEASCSARPHFMLRLIDHDGAPQATAPAGSNLAFTAGRTDAYYLQVLAHLSGPRTGAFELGVSYPLLICGLQREPAGWVLQWQAVSNRSYTMLSAPQLQGELAVAQSNLVGSGLVSTTGTVTGALQFWALRPE